MTMRIALTGGGTGGHLYPIIAVAEELQKISPDKDGRPAELMFLGPKTIGAQDFAAHGISSRTIMAGKIRRYFSLKNFVDIFKMPLGFLQALWHLFIFMPNVVFSKGGFGSVPVILAAWVYRIPVLTHESDAIPGLANKLAAKFCRRIAVSYLEAAKYFPPKKTALTGNPIRNELFSGTKEEAKKIFGLTGAKPVLLILGGSQGAQAINDVVFASLPKLISRTEIIHQCGKENFEMFKQLIANQILPGYFLFPFLDETQITQAYAAADLVVSRAGAGSIAEISSLGKPSIVVPLPNSSAEHQTKNALDFAKTGATVVLEQMNLTPHLFQDRIFALLGNPELLRKMGEAAKTFNPPDAARKIAEEILNIAKY